MPLLSFQETKNLLLKYKIPFSPVGLVNSKKEALTFAKKIGYPVVLKIYSPEVLHRTDLDLVKVGIEKADDLSKAFDEIFKKTKKIKIRSEGILVQKMVKGVELMSGMKRDRQFGPVLMFGLGGIFVEILNDVSLRIAPLSKREAMKMVKEIKGYKILSGWRGKSPLAVEKIVEILLNLSNLSLENPKIKEIDLNPIFVDEKKALAADFKFLI